MPLVNEVTYFSRLRRGRRLGQGAGLLAMILVSACASSEIQIVTPFSKHITGPRSFEVVEKEIQAQSQPFRDLYFRVQADYPHFINSYKVDLLIDDDGDVDSAVLIERDYIYKDFENEFMHLVKEMQFTECDCPRTRIVYTFRFASQLPARAKTEAQLAAEKQETDRKEAAHKAVEDENATLRLLPPGNAPLPQLLGPVGESAQASSPDAVSPPADNLPDVKPDTKADAKPDAAKPESKKDSKGKLSKDADKNRVKPDPIPEDLPRDPNAPDTSPYSEPPAPPSGPASPEEIPPSPEIP